MNVNFVYNDFSDDGYPLANCSKNGNSNKWFDSSNFFSSYLNDSENDFDYLGDDEKFNVLKHPLKNILINPTDLYFYMVSHPGLSYHDLCDLPNLGLSAQIIKRLKTNINFYLVYLREHEADRIGGLGLIIDKLNRLGIDHKVIICNNDSNINENLEKIKKIHNFNTKAKVYKLNFLQWSSYQVMAFKNDEYKAYEFEFNEEKTGKFFMCRNKGAKPHRMGLIAFLRANKDLEENTNYSCIGNVYYGDLVRKLKPFFETQFIIDNAREIFELKEFYKEDDYEAGKNWIGEGGEFIHKDLAPIYLVPELHEAFSNSYMNVVTESEFNSSTEVVHITEKSYRPFYYYQYPIFFASPNHVNELRKMGLDLFDDIIDHSYDLIKDDGLLFKAICKELDRIEKIKTEFIKNYSSYKDRFYKNREILIKAARKHKIKDIQFFKNTMNEYKQNIHNTPII